MSDETQVEKPAEVKLTYPAGIKQQLDKIDEDTKQKVSFPLTVKAIVKSAVYKNCPYIAPIDIKTKEDLDKVILFNGLEWVCDRINNSNNQMAIQAMYQNATKGPEKNKDKDDGDIIQVNWAAAIKQMEEGRVSGETIGALEEKKDLLSGELQELIRKFDKLSNPVEMTQVMIRLKKINEEVAKLNDQIDARSEAFKARKAGKSGSEATVPAPLVTA